MTEPRPDETAPSAPAGTPARAAPARSGARWGLAFGLAGLILAVTAIGIVALGGRSTPEALRYVPRDMTLVAELRLDLPGDQLEKVGNLLAHFPGFKDQSILPQKIDESLDRLTTSVSSGSVNYATQLKPWLAGPLFAAAETPTSSASASHFLVVATTDGKVTCDPLFGGEATSKETYRGIQIQVSSDGLRACALDGRYGLIGDAASVRAGLDAHATGSGIDGLAQYRTARDALGSDRLATVYVAREFVAGVMAARGGISDGNPFATPAAPAQASSGPGGPFANLPAWMMMGLRAEDDALVLDVVDAAVPPWTDAAGSPRPTFPADHASRIAPLLPSDTAVLFEMHGTGIGLENGLAALREDPQYGTAMGQIDSGLAFLGGAHGLVGWIDDAGVAVVPDGSNAAGGAILLATDEATAADKVAQLRSLITLAGIGGSVVSHDTTVNGTTVTTVDVSDLSALVPGAGSRLPGPSGTPVVLSFAAHGSAVIIGGEGFAASVLGTAAGSSLADQAGYRHAFSRAAAQNAGQIYVSVPTVLGMIEKLLPAAATSGFNADVLPYFGPLDVILESTWTDHGMSRARFLLTVK